MSGLSTVSSTAPALGHGSYSDGPVAVEEQGDQAFVTDVEPTGAVHWFGPGRAGR